MNKCSFGRVKKKKKSPLKQKCWASCPDSDSLLVCQWSQLYCYEYYVPLMTLSISDKPPFVGLSPQFSFTGEGVEKGACIVFSCSLSSDCWHIHNNVKSLNISHWSSSSGLQSPLCGENKYRRTHAKRNLSFLVNHSKFQSCWMKNICTS